MSLFDKDELRRDLERTKKELLDAGEDEQTAERLTRREFVRWLEGFTGELRETIAANAALPAQGRDERIARQREDFDFFRRTYFPHYYYLPGKSELQAYLETVYRRIAGRAGKRAALGPGSPAAAASAIAGEKFAVAAPRGHGKSTDVSVVFLIWVVVNKLKHFPVLFSDAIELTETLIEAVKAELEENENLKADFPAATGVGRVWKIGDIVTKNGVRIKGYGSGKRVRGVKHGTHRPDLAVIDDLENDENVRSRTQRDKLEKWLDEAVDNLGDVTGNLDIIYIGTLLHRDSVLARKLRLAFWNPRIFRAIKQFPRRMDLWETFANLLRTRGTVAADEFYEASKPEMDEGAAVMWPGAVPLKTLMTKRAQAPNSFAKEQQNNPGSDTQTFRRETMHFYKDRPQKGVRYYGYCDPAGSRKKSDFTSFTILAVSDTLRKAWVAESINRVMPSKEIVETLVDLQERYRCKKFGYETNGGQAHLVPYIKDRAFDRGVHLPLKEVNSTESKQERIEELEIPIESGEIELHASQGILIEQLEDFPEGLHDDAPDSLAGCYRLTKLAKRKKRGGARKRAPRPQTRQTQYGRLP